MTALPGLLARALWRWAHGTTVACWRWACEPAHRRSLTVLPFVLLGHVLLVWLLIQNRWIVMSETTIPFMPPIMASIMLSAPMLDKDGKPSNASGKPNKASLDGELTLKPSPELSFGALRVQRSVPWLNTELLPELRGNNADPKADRQERVGSADPRPRDRLARNSSPGTAAKPVERRPPPLQPQPPRVARTERPAAMPAEPLPAPAPPPPVPPSLALIPPPPALAEVRPPPPVIPAPAIPPIPDPVQSGPRDIPPLWAPTPALPPPVLTVIPPTPPAPPVLATLPAAPPPPAAPPAPATAAAPPPAPAPTPAPPPPRTAAAVVTPPPPKALPAPVEAAAPPPPAPPAPLVLTPATELPKPASPPPMATTVIVSPPPSLLPSTPDMAGSSATSTPAPNSTEASPARNPMVVEIPRYRMAEPSPAASPNAPAGPGTSGSAASTSDNGGRTGPAGAGSPSGSVLGLGVEAPAPPPLPTASAPNSAQARALNLTLPKVEVYRPPAPRGPSLSELANAQLRRSKPKDPMAEGMEDAVTPDCMRPGKDQTATGLLAGPIAAYNAVTGKCR